MKRLSFCLFLLSLPLAAQQYKMAVIGMVHSHFWGHLPTMLKGEQVQLAGIAEPNPELVAEAKRRGASAVPFYADYRKMLDEVKPDLVWAFVENNRHLEIVEACAPRKINVIFEKPLAATYKEAVEIRKLAQQHDIRVMTNYQRPGGRPTTRPTRPPRRATWARSGVCTASWVTAGPARRASPTSTSSSG